MDKDASDIGDLRETEVLEDAEDHKTVRLIGERGSVDVRMTNGSVVKFVGLAEEVFGDRQVGVVDREDQFNVHPDDVEGVHDRRNEP